MLKNFLQNFSNKKFVTYLKFSENVCISLRFRRYFFNISEKFPFIYRISLILSYVFQIFSRLVVAFNQPFASRSPSSHDDLILSFSYVPQVLHNFSWGSYSAGFHKNYERIDGLRRFTFKTDGRVYLNSLTRIFFL